MILSKNLSNTNNWKNLCYKLVLENCLTFGLNPQLTSKKITKYLLGTRDTLEIFKLYELRYLLLRIYPLIHTLFYNPRVNSRFEFKASKSKSAPALLVKDKSFPLKKKKFPKKKVSFSFRHKNLPPQILFATTTKEFSEIILEASKICNMPCHQKRWVNGTITAAISNFYEKDLWLFRKNLTHQKISHFFNQRLSLNKENSEKIKEKSKYYESSRWPSLVVIPDVLNNTMIISEIKKVGIPVIGLVNSHCSIEIDYPIFAQDQTFASVHFFCYFLSILIAKEMVYSQHKHYALQKMRFKIKKKEVVKKQNLKESLKKYFFFKKFLPSKEKSSQRYLGYKRFSLFPMHPHRLPFFWQYHKIFTKRHRLNSYIMVSKMFGDLISYLQYKKFNSFLPKNLKNIYKFQKQKFEQDHVFPWQIIFEKEKRKKFFSNRTQNSLLHYEKLGLKNNLLQNFLWILKKNSFHWKYKALWGPKFHLENNKYYWESSFLLVQDSRWLGYKHKIRKFLHLKKNVGFDKGKPFQAFLNSRPTKHYANNKKKSWKRWVQKTTPSIQKNRTQNTLFGSKKTYAERKAFDLNKKSYANKKNTKFK